MKTVLIQCNLKLGDVPFNFEMIEKKIRQAASKEPDIIVLPEMWNTSFFPKDVKSLADQDSTRTKKFLSSLAKEYKVNIVGGSVARTEQNKLYNTSYIYNRKGEELAHYDKVHTFSPSGEHNYFESGNHMTTFELDTVKCGVIICYDLRFVEWVRMYALQGVQILFVPAAWPDKRILHWDILNRARAIENQMFVVNVNSVGHTEEMHFGGHSSIIDPWGEYIISPDDSDDIKIGEINLNAIQEIRTNINVFQDRREKLYHF